jgi:uncharacterized protein with PIN domain
MLVNNGTAVCARRNRIRHSRVTDYECLAHGRTELHPPVGRLDIVPLNAHQLDLARNAYRSFGTGYHRAALNFGDCCAYALAASTGESLLFKGVDFAHTDIPRVLPPA